MKGSRTWIRALACCAWALLAGCQPGEPGEPARVEAPPDTASGEVAFEWAGRDRAAILVPVYINGQGPFDLVLDTGATYTCVDDSLAEQLELPDRSGAVGIGTTIHGQGRIRLVSVDSIRVGGATAADLPACVLPFPQVKALGIELKGLLGLNFLRSFHLTLDFERNVLRLQDPSSP